MYSVNALVRISGGETGLVGQLWFVFRGTLAHMLLQRGGYNERHVAIATLEYVLASLAVGLHVAGQLAALGTRVGTQLTLVGLLSGMRSPMDCQVAAVLEDLATILARVVLALANQLLA